MFKVITSYPEAQALGQCGLLWWTNGAMYVPSTTTAVHWATYDITLKGMVESGEYAILLEE